MVHGVLLLDKPLRLSSNAALQKARRLFGGAKAGHTGTLDPLATGLLPICFGDATKFSYSLLDADKTYEAIVRLGFESSTGDAEGEIVHQRASDVGLTQLEEVLGLFSGPIQQIPPMHSALKKDGRPLYEYARAGEEIAREPREVFIKDMQLINYNDNIVTLRVRCSKGTYIRVLAQDIGKALGCGGYLLGLRRTGVDDLEITDAIGLDELDAMLPAERVARLLPADRLSRNLPFVQLDADLARKVLNGLEIHHAGSALAGKVRLYGPTGKFLGVGEVAADGLIVPKRMIANIQEAESVAARPE